MARYLPPVSTEAVAVGDDEDLEGEGYWKEDFEVQGVLGGTASKEVNTRSPRVRVGVEDSFPRRSLGGSQAPRGTYRK